MRINPLRARLGRWEHCPVFKHFSSACCSNLLWFLCLSSLSSLVPLAVHPCPCQHPAGLLQSHSVLSLPRGLVLLVTFLPLSSQPPCSGVFILCPFEGSPIEEVKWEVKHQIGARHLPTTPQMCSKILMFVLLPLIAASILTVSNSSPFLGWCIFY